MRHAVVRHEADRGEGDGVALVGGAVIIYDGDDAAVVAHLNAGGVVAVDVTVDPVEELDVLLGVELIAVEIHAVGVVYVIIPAAGDKIISAVGKWQSIAEGLVLHIYAAQLHAVFAPHRGGNAAVAETDERVDKPAVINGNVGGDAAVERDDVNARVAGSDDVVVIVNEEIIGVDAVAVIVVPNSFDLRAAEHVAVLVERADVVRALILAVVIILIVRLGEVVRAVVPRGIGALHDDELALRARAYTGEIGAGVVILEVGGIDSRGVDCLCLCGCRRGRVGHFHRARGHGLGGVAIGHSADGVADGLIVDKLAHRAGKVDKIEPVLINVVLALVAGGLILRVLPLADLYIGRGVKTVVREKAGVHIALAVREYLVELGVVDIRRGLLIGLGCAGASVRAAAAAGAERQRHHEREQRRREPFDIVHHSVLLSVCSLLSICPCMIMFRAQG